MSTHDSALAHHFEDMEQQNESAILGMWLFLAQEIMFFGGLFAAYAIYRAQNPEAFGEASSVLNLPIGFGNTLVLLTSSLTMALAVNAAQLGNQKALVRNLTWTLLLGTVFLVVKVFEYRDKWIHHEIPGINFQWHGADAAGAEMFFVLYFCMTGLHALHMIIGAGILMVMIPLARKGRFNGERFMPVEIFGFYWHFVDIVWVFLFPLLYLIDRTGH